MKTSTFHIAEMCCPTEQKLVSKKLQQIQGVSKLDFNGLSREVLVTHQLTDHKPLLEALQSLNLGATERGSETSGNGTTIPKRSTWPFLAVSGVLATGAEALAWSTGQEQSALVIGLAVVSMLAGGTKTLKKGVMALRSLTLNINFLMTLAVAGAIALGQWPEAAMVTFLFALAERLEEYSLDRASDAIGTLVKLMPDKALLLTCCGDWKEVDAATVKIGQTVRVRAEERIPLDGKVTSGFSSVNQAPITGESWPVKKAVGDPVYAGTINGQGAFEFAVTASSEGTTLARIIRAVRQAQSEKSPIQRLVDKFAEIYTPAVVVLAILTAVVPPYLWGGTFAEWFYKALVILVVSCPCALVISTPVTIMSGLAAAARFGILVKGGAVLEEGRKLGVLALDKTGTLTQGAPRITSFYAGSLNDEKRALLIASSLNSHSRHPIASSFKDVCEGPLLSVNSFESLTGRGVRGEINGFVYSLGNRRLAEEKGLMKAPFEAQLGQNEERGETSVILMDDTGILALFAVADALRESSLEAIAWLHQLGIKTVMLSGDNQATASTISRQAGIDDARGDLLPEDKLAAIEALVDQYGCAGMVGDGVNDAPALAKASIGFAMGAAGTETAIESADVALMNDDPRKLPLFIELSRHVGAVIKQNIALAIGIKVIFLVLALRGEATLGMAVMADMGGSLAVIFNGLRVLRFKAIQPNAPIDSRHGDA